MAKRLTCFLLMICMLVAIVPFSVSAASTYSKPISAYNSTRYENYLVIFNKNGSKTGTNPYGYEVVVTDGMVTAIGGNDSLVPNGTNSFVVSGHGTMSDWLSANITLGMKASYSTTTNTVTFVSDGSTLINAISLVRQQALDAKAKAIEACLVYNEAADTKLTSAEQIYNNLLNNYNNNGQAPTQIQASTLSAQYNTIVSLYTENAVSEYRGAWVRPVQTNYSAVESYVKQAYDAGLNMLSVETLYSGTMIFPTPSGSLFEHNPKFGNFDVLDAYITACHKYGMELHVWMPIFYSGSNGDANWKRSVAYKKPEWCLYSNSGRLVDSDEYYGLIFLNPALPEVQDYLIETYTYILENYDIDGFQLDYIRYRDRTDVDDYGYDEYTINAFKEAYPKYVNVNITYNTSASYWGDWVKFRAQQVTNMVDRARALIDRVAPDVMLTADVGPARSQAYSNLYQDFPTWLTNGSLDMIHPMAYGVDYSPFMYDFMEWAGDDCLVVPGLGTYMEEFDASDMLRQTREMLEVGCDGVVYFEITAFFSKNCGSTLTSNIFTEKAIPPHLNIMNTLKANLERLSERAIKAASAGTITTALKNEITAKARSAASVSKPSEAISALEELETILAKISSEPLYNRMHEDLVRAAQTCARDLRDCSEIFEKLEDKLLLTDTEHFIVLGQGEQVLTYDQLTSYLPYGKILKNGKEIGSGDPLGTNYVLTNGMTKFTIIVKGDVNCDGKISSLDYNFVKRHVLGTMILQDLYHNAANVQNPNSEKINALDYMAIKRHVIGTASIYG